MPVALSPIFKVGGSTLAAQSMDAIREVQIEREMQVPGRLSIRFADPGYVLAEAGTFTLGAAVDVTDPSGSKTLFSGEVTALAVDQPIGEQPQLVVTALDKSHRLGRTLTFQGKQQASYKDLITQMVSDVGLQAEVTGAADQFPFVMQADSNLTWLTEMARRTGSDWWVDDGKLYFQSPPSELSSSLTLKLGDGLLSFSVKVAGYAPSSVTVNGWDYSQQAKVSSQVSSATGGLKPSAKFATSAVSGSTLPEGKFIHNGLSPTSEGEARTLGQAVIDHATAGSTVAKGVLSPGSGDITLGSTVEVQDAGPLSGKYPVTAVEHVFRPGSGFVTRFRSGDRRSRSLVESLAGSGAVPGLAMRYPAVVIGKVTSLKDASNLGRVQVKYPGRDDQMQTGWARVLGIGGGSQRGIFYLPEVNNEVLISFEDGDPRRPVVLGAVHSDNFKLPTTTPTMVNSSSGTADAAVIRTRLGQQLFLLDGQQPAQQGIQMTLSKTEQKIDFNNESLTIQVGDGIPITIKSGSNASIAFDKQGGITIKGTKITIQGEQQVQMSGAQISASADEQLQLQGQVKVAVSGAAIAVQADAEVQIQGTMVQIN